MPILEVRNITFKQISTTIGLLEPIVQGGVPVSVQLDVIPRSLIDELETFRKRNWITYNILEDPDISDDREASLFTPLIGEPSSGSLPSPLTPKLTIADAIQNMAEGASSLVGTPTSGDYSGVLPSITETTRVADAFQAFGEFNAAIAPDQPGTLVGQNLTIVGTTQFSAKIPSGLPSTWSALTPGDTISNMIVDGAFVLESPDQADRFLAGFANDLSSAGSLDLVEDGSVAETYDIAANGVGTIGRISITDISEFNDVWQKVNAEFAISLSIDGRHRFRMDHTESGNSDEREFYFDDVNTAPTFSSAMSVVINNVVSKFLSGIEALGFGSQLDISYTAAAGIFEKTYHPTAVGQVSGPAHTVSIDNPSSVPAFNDTFPVSRTISLDISNVVSLTPSYTAVIQKPDGQTDSSFQSISKAVNTYGIVSTGKDEQFLDEDKRIVLDTGTTSGTATPFDSTVALINGNAQQLHDGSLRFPISSDYPGFSGDQEYQRFIDKVGASTGQLTLQSIGSISFSDIEPFGTGDLNMLIELAVEGIFFDLGRSIGDDNGDGSGDSRANSIGARNDAESSGNVLAWSFGTNSTAFNNDEYRLIVIFKNQNKDLFRITEA